MILKLNIKEIKFYLRIQSDKSNHCEISFHFNVVGSHAAEQTMGVQRKSRPKAFSILNERVKKGFVYQSESILRLPAECWEQSTPLFYGGRCRDSATRWEARRLLGNFVNCYEILCYQKENLFLNCRNILLYHIHALKL